LGGHAILWQSNANLSLAVVVCAAVWSQTAFSMLLFIAAIKNVPTSYYEAASIDGADSWHLFRHITLPGIAPTSFIVILLSTLTSMKEYPLFLSLNGGGPGTSNNLIVQYIYNTGFSLGQIGYASAASFVQIQPPSPSTVRFFDGKNENALAVPIEPTCLSLNRAPCA